MDVLSYMLQMVRLRTSIYATVQLQPPWGVGIPRTDAAAFHAVLAGRCWFWLGGSRPHEPIELAAGDVVVVPHGDAHTFCDEIGSPIEALDPIVPESFPTPSLGDAGDPREARVICGHLWFDDRDANPLVGMLPPTMVFRGTRDGHAAVWLQPILAAVAAETQPRQLGGNAVLARLSDVIVIQTIRAHLATLPATASGWLRALTDPQLGAALALIHQHPETPWTVAQLASKVGASRSSFAARFTELVGEPPLQYVTRWRMHHAQGLLQRSTDGVAQIAARVGYTAEPAFSRAFKRFFGIAPSEFRRNALAVVSGLDQQTQE